MASPSDKPSPRGKSWQELGGNAAPSAAGALGASYSLQHTAATLAKEVMTMPEYRLYCFAQSGNAYRAALMLNHIRPPELG